MNTLKFYTCYIYFLIAFLSGTTVLSAQTNGSYISTADGKNIRVSDLNSHIEKSMDSLQLPGLSIAIINKAEIVYHNSFGLSNLKTKEKIDDQSIFEAASLSKPLFAYFALRMADKGLLDLDKPLYEYLPHPAITEESQEDYKLITARMVLSHSTGFPNWSNGNKIKLSFVPGNGFSYSGEAYQYLAAIIGQLNGVGWQEDLNDLFLKEVTLPLGMEHTSFVWNDYFKTHKAFGHDNENTPTDNGTGGWNGKTFGAAYSAHSQAADYAKFLIAMLREEGLKKSTFTEMLKEHNTFNKDSKIRKETGQSGWSLGFAIKPTSEGKMYLHTGNNRDFQAYCAIIPEKEYGLVLFTNSGKMLAFVKSLGNLLGEQF